METWSHWVRICCSCDLNYLRGCQTSDSENTWTRTRTRTKTALFPNFWFTPSSHEWFTCLWPLEFLQWPKYKPFWLPIVIVSFPYCSVLYFPSWLILPLLPSHPCHSAFWSRCSSSHGVPYPSWPELKPGTVPRTPLLWEGLLILPRPLPFPFSVSRLEGKNYSSPSFSMFFPKHSFSSFKHNISPLRPQQSCSTHSIPFHCHLSTFWGGQIDLVTCFRVLYANPHRWWYSHSLSLSVPWRHCLQGPHFPFFFQQLTSRIISLILS